ncbi:hypothetical protein BP00DRAFT_491761 [Aspergillus indologenus CBS 114.80]|uniref:Uncharacterized protein n=1 Tax=Aspergillus indologenus CBS 114.80 TaxID=1450541 RepID=A0A2V5IIY5_9EURO|nr:hypothetical protein BP00DRAFT_491761 [Aspergillus indologenus CBS 114.80]
MGYTEKQQAEIALGPIGTGIYYLCQWISPPLSNSQRLEQAGPLLAGWSLAINLETDDLVFLKTAGYHSGYLQVHPAPGGAHFLLKEWMVKSRDSDANFNVLYVDDYNEEGPDFQCTRENLVEFSRWWNGYELTGDEKKYYLTLIKAIIQREEKEANDRYRAQEEADAKNLEELKAKYPNGIGLAEFQEMQDQHEQRHMWRADDPFHSGREEDDD